jgi:hypothetical protein
VGKTNRRRRHRQSRLLARRRPAQSVATGAPLSARSQQKYKNHGQLVQGVSQVDDRELTQGERLLLNVLAAFNVKNNPHPGNDKLARACGVTSRQGVNRIVNKMVAKKLIEIAEVGNGRGKTIVLMPLNKIAAEIGVPEAEALKAEQVHADEMAQEKSTQSDSEAAAKPTLFPN